MEVSWSLFVVTLCRGHDVMACMWVNIVYSKPLWGYQIYVMFMCNDITKIILGLIQREVTRSDIVVFQLTWPNIIYVRRWMLPYYVHDIIYDILTSYNILDCRSAILSSSNVTQDLSMQISLHWPKYKYKIRVFPIILCYYMYKDSFVFICLAFSKWHIFGLGEIQVKYMYPCYNLLCLLYMYKYNIKQMGSYLSIYW